MGSRYQSRTVTNHIWQNSTVPVSDRLGSSVEMNMRALSRILNSITVNYLKVKLFYWVLTRIQVIANDIDKTQHTRDDSRTPGLTQLKWPQRLETRSHSQAYTILKVRKGGLVRKWSVSNKSLELSVGKTNSRSHHAQMARYCVDEGRMIFDVTLPSILHHKNGRIQKLVCASNH